MRSSLRQPGSHRSLSNVAQVAAALVLISMLLWGSAYLAVSSLEGHKPHLRTHRASPLPRRAARKGVTPTAVTERTSGEAVPALLPRFFDDLADDQRELQSALRLHEVGIEVLSWTPRIFLLHDLLTAEECDHLRSLAAPELEASTVVDTATGEGKLSAVRTSSGMFITENTDITERIRARIAHITLLPEENQEAISVLRYQPGQFYRPHQDFFADQININRGGQRTATVLIYLTDVERGGETIFPQGKEGGGSCACGGKTATGMSVRPRKGNAVLFWTMTPGGKEDSNSVHGSCEVLAGEKWSATLWIRTGIEENYTDKSKCAPFFNAYKECKKADYEAARAARIKAHSG